MIHALLRSSCTQSTLVSSFACASSSSSSSKIRSTSKISTAFTSSTAIFRQTTLPFGRETAQKRLRDIVLGTLGKCVRVHESFHRFVRRANIVYFRLCVSSSPFALSCALLLHYNLTHNIGLNLLRVFFCPPCSRGLRSALT